jgi:hypothetical protein
MICKICNQDITPECCKKDICVFCKNNVTEWFSHGVLITRYEAIIPRRCPNCSRLLPNINFKRKHGCPSCVPEKPIKYNNGIINDGHY